MGDSPFFAATLIDGEAPYLAFASLQIPSERTFDDDTEVTTISFGDDQTRPRIRTRAMHSCRCER